MKALGLLSAGFIAGFATLFILIMIFGDYGDETTAAIQPVAVAQSTTSTPRPSNSSPTSDAVLEAFANAGIEISNIDRAPQLVADSPLPRSFRHHVAWHDALLGDKGGQLFICDSPDLCSAIASYFQMLSGMAGPYIYTSPNGLIVVQLNSGFNPDQAARYRAVLDGF